MEVYDTYFDKIQAVGTKTGLIFGKRKILDQNHINQLDAIAEGIKKDNKLREQQKTLLLSFIETRKLEWEGYAKGKRRMIDGKSRQDAKDAAKFQLELLKEKLKKGK